MKHAKPEVPRLFLASSYKFQKKVIIFGYSLEDFDPTFILVSEKNEYIKLNSDELTELITNPLSSLHNPHLLYEVFSADDTPDESRKVHLISNAVLRLRLYTNRLKKRLLCLENLVSGIKINFDKEDLDSLKQLSTLIAVNQNLLNHGANNAREFYNFYIDKCCKLQVVMLSEEHFNVEMIPKAPPSMDYHRLHLEIALFLTDSRVNSDLISHLSVCYESELNEVGFVNFPQTSKK